MRKASKDIWIRGAIAICAIIGFGFMGYLSVIHYTQARSFCDLSETVSCDVVTTSIYSEIFGIPLAILGALYFAGVLVLSYRMRGAPLYSLLLYLTLFVLVPSLYLSLTEIFFIRSFCILCESSKVLMVTILAISFFHVSRRPTMRDVAPIIIAGVVVSGVTYFGQTSSIAKADYSTLVACLNDRGLVYYKSKTCSNCRRQELILGDAYQRMTQVECHPDGVNAQPELCLAKNIDKTPTFILEENGKELKRLEGRQVPKDLALFVSCPFDEP